MTRQIKSLAVLVLCLFVFGACNSRFSISKRKYLKGYYVSHSKATYPQAIKSTARKPGEITSTPINNKVAFEQSTTSTASILVRDASANASRAKKNKSIVISAITDIPSMPFLSPFSFYKIKPLQKINEYSFVSKREDSSRDKSTFSLLWIPIVLIVFLWYLAFLAGWGSPGIINLLLILAFILLVLWLLRIL